jgi:hypothetical protein
MTWSASTKSDWLCKKNHKEKTIEKGEKDYTSAQAMEESKCKPKKLKLFAIYQTCSSFFK